MDTRSPWVYDANASLHLPALTTYVNVLSVILVSYHTLLLLFLLLLLLRLFPDDDSAVDEKVERHKVKVWKRIRERERERTPRGRDGEAAGEKRMFEERRRRGPGIPEPGLDPRPSPPKSSTAARPQFRFVFSAPLCSFLLFSSLRERFSFSFFYLSPSLSPFFFDLFYQKTTETTDRSSAPSFSFLVFFLHLRPPMFLRRVLTGENCGKNVDPCDPLQG